MTGRKRVAASHVADVVAAGPGPLAAFAEAFWSKADRSGGPDACWPWAGPRGGKGYGIFFASGRRRLAHRVALELSAGPVTDGRFSCHRCDNPPCCNPAHLFAGTAFQNILDAQNKGRMTGPRGELARAAKLCEFTVRLIRSTNLEPNVLAELFGIGAAHAWTVRRGYSWRHVDPETLPPLRGHRTAAERKADAMASRQNMRDAATRRWARERAARASARVDLYDPADPPECRIDGAFVDLGPMPAWDDPSSPDPVADTLAELTEANSSDPT